MIPEDEHVSSPVIIIVPPVVQISFPAIGPSLLAAACREAGIPARVAYPSLDFAARIGLGPYTQLLASPSDKMLGEIVFAAVFPGRRLSPGAILDELANRRASCAALGIARAELEACIGSVTDFVADTAARILARAPRIVAFSSMFQQNLASVAIARALKAQQPNLVTVVGGANVMEPMGSALLGVTDAFDFVFSGEADLEFPAFCRAFLATGTLPERRLIACEPLADLDHAATPRYDDYFNELAALRETGRFPADWPAFLPFESSRGCWYAAKKPCTFCAFNTTLRRFRAKSPPRILAELRALAEHYGHSCLWAVDNIMPDEMLRTVLPELAAHPAGYTLAYELRPNLGPAQLDLLARAGVPTIQPGIESLATPLLRLIGKGVTALRSLVFLRDARSCGLNVVWNFITAIPGEHPRDYRAMLALLPWIEHLPAPFRSLPTLFHRYSRYHEDPGRYGIRRLRPLPVYGLLYGPQADLENLAHTFEAEYDTVAACEPDLWGEFDSALRHWMRAWADPAGPPLLAGTRRADGGLEIVDTRAGAVRLRHRLAPPTAAALEALRMPVRPQDLPPAVLGAAEPLLAARLATEYEGRLVSLVTGV